MTGGLAFEALNHAGSLERDLVVVLNDNQMFISRRVGAMSGWLSHRLGYQIGLPTEWQWQQAATGEDPEKDHVYPWGKEWDNCRTNTRESELGCTTAVGMYPHGASPVGALDMAGNVWEFCLNEFDWPRQTLVMGKVNRVLRGGSFNDGPDLTRAADRYDIHPSLRNLIVGFRVSCASPHRVSRWLLVAESAANWARSVRRGFSVMVVVP